MGARHIEEISGDPASGGADQMRYSGMAFVSSDPSDNQSVQPKLRAQAEVDPIATERAACMDRDVPETSAELIYSCHHQIARGRRGRSRRILPSRLDYWDGNFQNMQENRVPGERLDRHPAAGTWGANLTRFHRDRSHHRQGGWVLQRYPAKS